MTGKQYNKLARIAYVALAALFAVQASALAQTENNAARPERGISPLGSYAVSDIESVSLTNGNLNLSIPLASLPPIAGGKLSWTVRAIYNSKMWDLVREEIDPGVFDQFGNPAPHYVTSRLQLANGQGGWHVGEQYSITFQNSVDDLHWLPPPSTDPEYCLFTHYSFTKTILTMPDGSTHELRPLDYTPYQGNRPELWGYYIDQPYQTCNHSQCPPSSCPTNTIRYYSFDGSFIWAKVFADQSWEMYLPDGTKVTQSGGIQRIIDTNGNSIKIYSDTNGAGHTVTHYLDERGGREITQEWIPGSGNQYTLRESYKLVGGTTSALVDVNFNTISIVGKTYEVTDHFPLNGEQCFRLEPLGAVVDVVKSISLPPTEPNQTRSFTFGYNCDTTHSTNGQYQPTCDPASAYPVGSDSIGWGSLSRMTTPSGAVAQYTYSLDNVQELSTDVQQSNGLETVEASRESVTSKSLTHDGQAADVWTYTIATMGGGDVVGPDGGKTQELIYAHDPAYSNVYGGSTGLGGMAYRTSQFDKAGLEKTRIERHWITMKFTGANDVSPGQPTSLAPFNPVVDVEYTTLFDSSGGLTNAKMSAKKFTYGYNGNLAVEQDYDWFSPSALPGRDAQGVPTGIPSGLQPIRVISNSYYNPAPLVTTGDTGANTGNVYAKRSISNVTPLILNAKKDTSGSSATTQLSYTQFSYDGNAYGVAPTSKGNLTLVHQQKDASTFIDTSYEYNDAYGNRTASVDPDLNRTEYAYDASTHAQPTTITVYPDRLDTNNKHITSILYDASTGLVLSQTDPNGKTTDTDYTNQVFKDASQVKIDPYGRPGVVTDPQGRTAVTRYVDHLNMMNVTADLKIASDAKLKSQTSYDMLGRVIKTESNEGGSSYTISSDSVYKFKSTGGQIVFTSNPHRSSGASTDGWTRATQDELGRVVEVATFSGSTQPADTGTTNTTGVVATSYVVNQVTVTDQDLKTRSSTTDALGRLSVVTENPGGSPTYDTSYGHDALGNLLTVTQGAQTRTFTYDMLSRLKTAKNPEQVNTSGVQVATSYDYDSASNLLTRTNPNLTTVTFTYDGLKRVKTKALSGGPSFTYAYDTATNGKGRLTSVTTANGDGNYYDSYDAMGRTTSSHQITDGHSYSFSPYVYDLAGNMTSETYPSGRVVTTAYDDAGRISGVTGQVQQATKTYVDTFSYTAEGAVAAMKFGTDSSNPRWEHTTFNSRLQPTLIGVGTNGTTDSSVLRLDYLYGSTDARNNGNMRQQKISIGVTVFTQDYTYDALNRLQTANETVSSQTSWSQTYGYDRWGNRWVSGNMNFPLNTAMTPQSQSQIDPATNRIKPDMMPSPGFSYDVSGNLDGDPTTGAHHIGYDAENHQTSYNNGAATYVYDGEGRRVKKIVAGSQTVTTIYVYNAANQMVAEYKDQAASGSGGTQFVAADHLGSTRLLMNTTGTVTARYDYLPFGEEIPSSLGGRSAIAGYNPTATINEKFTQKERDNESALDYFKTRYYSSAQGRFTSADQPFVDQEAEDPQSWNLYSYVRNKPLIWTDPSGLAHWEEMDGKKFWVGDYGGEYDESTKLYWNAKTQEWGERPKATKPASFGAGFLLGLTGIHDLFARWVLGEDTSQTSFLRGVQRDNPKTGIAGELTGVVASAGVTSGLVKAGASLTEITINGTAYATKDAARQALARMALSEAQRSAANAAIRRATTSSTIEIIQEGSNVMVRVARPGFDGFQVIESVVDTAGNKTVVQKAFDASGNLVHYDPKTP